MSEVNMRKGQQPGAGKKGMPMTMKKGKSSCKSCGTKKKGTC